MSYMFAAASSAAARQAQLSASSARSTANAARTKANLLSSDVEKLFMITEALWSIVRDQMGFTDDDIIRLVQDIDMRDGKLDGNVAKQINPDCPSCGRKLLGKHPACLYCGALADRDPFQR